MPVVVAGELLGVDREVADVAAEDLGGLFVGAAGAEDHRPVGPRLEVAGGDGFVAARFGGAGEELELLDALGALALRGAEAVGAGVAAAEDDHVLVLGGDEVGGRLVAEHVLVGHGQVRHGRVDALELASGDVEVAGLRRAAAEDDGVELLAEVLDADVDADVGVSLEDDAGLFHQLDAAEDDALLELEVGDAVHQQPADAVRALEDGDEVPGLIELGGAPEARRTGADDGDLLAGALLGLVRVDGVLERLVASSAFLKA
jgi:hypothetical protein